MLKEKAIEYIKHDFSIIPVGKDKRPLIEWKQYQERRATVEEIEKWFTDYPDMQIGIVTGKISNLLVVDIDKPDMDLSWLPITTIIKTGSGGFHYYYAYIPGVSNKARIKEYIDIRGDGGYVVAPPSENLKGKYEVKERNGLKPFPISLFVKDAKPYVKADTQYQGYGKGQRNDEMTRYIGHLLAKVHPSTWETIAWREAQEANQKNTPPLSEYELKAIFNSISSKERSNTTDRWYKQQEQKTEVPLLVKGEYTDRYTWGTNGLDKKLAIIKRGNFIIVGAKRNSGKTTYTFDLAMKNALLGHKVLYISLEMTEEKIISDFARKYAGINIEEEYFYAIPENKEFAYKRKTKEIKEIENLFFRGMRRGQGTSWNDILKLFSEFKELDLIIIDNLDLIEGEKGEHDIDRQKRVTKQIMNFTEEKNIPIILIHHHRKTGGNDHGSDELAGSGKIADNADIILKISRNTNTDSVYPEKYLSRIYQQKGRGYGEAAESIYFIKGSFVDEPPVEF